MKAKRASWVFVTYGGGHVRMLLPVACRIRELGLAEVLFIALTTARAEVEREGFACIGFRQLTWLHRPGTLERGRAMLADLGIQAIDPEESASYLGVNYDELEARHGVEEAEALYRRYGRQAFDPQSAMLTVMERLEPDLVVATSSPRSERAALRAAREAGIPSACLVDLFALDEIAWVGLPSFADRVCVLNERVRLQLLAAGRRSGEIVVTGNPAFDGFGSLEARHLGADLRRRRAWPAGRTVLFASGPEPQEHPFRPGVQGDPGLPGRTWAALCDAFAGKALQLVVRPHPSEAAALPRWMDTAEIAGQDVPLEALVNAVDLVVVLVSTVAVQASLAGCRVLQVSGSIMESAAPFLDYGFADAVAPPSQAGEAALQLLGRPAAARAAAAGDATGRVIAVLQGLIT